MKEKRVSGKRHTKEFREQVVLDFLDHPEMTYDDLCEKYEIADHSSVVYWVKQYINENGDPLSLIKEIRSLKQELQSVREDLANLAVKQSDSEKHNERVTQMYEEKKAFCNDDPAIGKKHDEGTELSNMMQVLEEVKALCSDDPMVGSTVQALWIDTLEISSLNDSEVVLKCSGEFHGNVVKQNYSDILQEKFEKALGHPVILHFIWAGWL